MAALEGRYDRVVLAATPPSPPAAGDLWTYGIRTSVALDALVVGIEHHGEGRGRLHCVDAAPGIHTADTEEIPVWRTASTRIDRSLGRAPPAPVIASVRSDEAALAPLSSGGYDVGILVALAAPSAYTVPVAHIDTQYRVLGTTEWLSVPPVPGDVVRVRIPGVTIGARYEIRVRAVSARHIPSDWTRTEHVVVGPIHPPPPPRNLLIDVVSDGTRRIRWSPPGPLDVVGYRLRVIGDVLAPIWVDMTPMHEGLLTSSPYETVDPITPSVYWIAARSVDASGLESDSSAWIRAELPPSRIGTALLWECPSATGWPGTYSTATYPVGRSDDGSDRLEGLGDYTWGDLTTWAAWESWGAGDGTQAGREIRYQPLRIDIGILATWSLDSSSVITSGTRTLWYRSSVSGRTWTPWTTYSAGTTVRARYLELQWVVTGDGMEVLTLDHVCYALIAPAAIDRILDLDTSSIPLTGSLGRRIPHNITHVTDVDVTLQGVSPGSGWSVRSKNPLVIDMWDRASRPITPVIDVIVRGVR